MTSSWLADKIEQWPTAKLVPYALNARTHSDAQVAQIAASIAEFGFTNPILAGSDGVIVAGHGRLAAAQKLGLEMVPVVVLDHLTPTQRRALVIADNRIAENAGWDDQLLRVELEALQDEGFDLDLTGFDADALAELLAGDEPDGEGETDDDAVPEVSETPVSRPGDVWLLGGHRLLCGDATVAASYRTLLDGEPVDMVFTDPPYNVNYANSAKDKMRGKDRTILNDNLGDGFYDFLLAALTPTIAHCRGGIYVAMSSSELDVLQAAFRAAGGKWSTFIIWAKNTFTLGRADYQRQYEPILYGWPEGAQRHWCGDRDQGDVWSIKKPQKNDLHPTMKPVELVERAIRNSSRPGNVVLDPFGGSGTTLIAAEKSGRLARLIELDPKYVDVIVRRWQDWTGQQATRESDGVAFDDLSGLGETRVEVAAADIGNVSDVAELVGVVGKDDAAD
ncbi:DNA adenine methyltransferase YhdJ [Ralstonia mannitolilytica]|uniref:site-specific DNA-methyltransferase n=1 Tax=Ralstonia mannitolilytica TaxID=105219 RepID=UPI000DFE04BA|nr:site-specific DNA-methyltransferase [Ralstonia mannitolilytica]SUD95459.1 DNA adenine methyltransferase YhdJ [Ralstonia mannitolilytica]